MKQLLGVVLVFSFLVLACEKNSTGSSSGPQQLSIQFANAPDTPAYIVVHRSNHKDVQNVFDMQNQTNMSYQVNDASSVTFTIVRQQGQPVQGRQSISAETFRKVPITSYRFDWDTGERGPQGALELQKPENSGLNRFIVSTPDWSMIDTSGVQFSCPLNLQSFTVFATGTNTTTNTGYYGWQTVDVDQVNQGQSIQVNLDKACQTQTLGSNELIRSFELLAVRSEADGAHSFLVSSNTFSDGKPMATVFLPNQFDNDYWLLQVEQAATNATGVKVMADTQVPGSVSFTLAEAEGQVDPLGNYKDLVLPSGSYATGEWFSYGDDHLISWSVYTSTSSTSLERPIVPDSVFIKTDVPLSFYGQGITVGNHSQFDNFGDYMRATYGANAGELQPPWSFEMRYTSMRRGWGLAKSAPETPRLANRWLDR